MLFKVVTTLTWQMESTEDYDACLNKARKQLNELIEFSPNQAQFENYNVQLDLVKMRDRHKLKHLQRYEPKEIFDLVTLENVKKEFIVNGVSYKVRMNLDRYFLFIRNPNCSACGLIGQHMYLDIHSCDNSAHFNLYGEEDGKLILLTIDHYIPRSKGGQNHIENYQTMCSICNNLKGNASLSLDQIKHLRELLKNTECLPKNKLKDLIQTTKQSMVFDNLGQENDEYFASFEMKGKIPDVITLKF